MAKENKRGLSILLATLLVVSMCMFPLSAMADSSAVFTKVTGESEKQIKAGETVTFTINLKSDKAIIGFDLRVYYDNEELVLNDSVGEEGFLSPLFGATPEVNGIELAERGRLAANLIQELGNSVDFTTEKTLATVSFTALKDTTATIGYGIKDLRAVNETNLFDEETGKSLSSSVVTQSLITTDGTLKSNNGNPVTGGQIINVTKGDVLRYEVSLKTPEEIAAWNIWVSYDENMLAVDETFGNEGLATNQGIPYALGEDDSFGQATDDNTIAYNGLTNTYSVSAADQAGYPGYTNGQRALVIQFVAKETGTTTLTHWVREITSITKNDYADIHGSGEVINGAVVTDEVVFVEQEPTPTIPVNTTPAPTTPVQTTPAKTTPAATTPVNTTPAPTTPVNTTPATTTPPTTTAPEPKGIYGDVNEDGVVDMIDVVMYQKHIAEILTLKGDVFIAGDVTKDGTIDMVDLVLVQKYVALMNVPTVGQPII